MLNLDPRLTGKDRLRKQCLVTCVVSRADHQGAMAAGLGVTSKVTSNIGVMIGKPLPGPHVPSHSAQEPFAHARKPARSFR